MAIIGAASVAPRKTAILPEGGRDFLRRRMMELVGTAVAGLGVVLLLALFTYSPGDPSLNHATGRAPHNTMGVPGAYISDLLLQTFGLAIVLVPVALITWGVRMVRTHHLGFFGLRLSLLLLALLMMSVACVGLGDVGAAATHAGPGGLVGLALVGRFRELVLTHSSGGSLALIEPACAALAFIAMAPALGMNRTDLPLIFRILRAPFLGGVWLVRAGISLWRGKPQSLNEEPDMPAPPIGYAEIPGEIDASQYDPAHFPPRFEQIPEEGAPLPARDSLMVDAPYAPIERPADEIPEMPADHQPMHSQAPTAAESVQERTLFDRVAGLRIEPILGRLRPAAPAAERMEPVPPASTAPEQQAAPRPEIEADDDNPFTPDALADPASAAAASGVTIVPRKSAAAQGKRAAKAGQRELDLATGEYKLPPLDILSLPSRVSTETKIDEEALEQNARLLETVLDDFGVKGQIVKVRPGPVVTLYELEPAPGTKSSRVIGLADDIARSMSAVSARVATVPGRNVIGIELPNARRETVFLRELLSTRHYEDNRLGLPLALGKDIGGDPVIADLARMPHLLIGGTTGSGKSVAVNTMILSLLYRLPPDRCRFIMIDPKMLELSVYQDIPHLLTPVVTEPRKAIVALKWVVREMEDRYRAMSATRRAQHRGLQRAAGRRQAQGPGADPPGPDRHRSRDAPAGIRGRGDRPQPAALHRGHHRRDGRPDAGRRQGDRGGRPAAGADGARRRHPRHHGHATAVGRRHHRHHQGQLPDPHLLPGHLQDRQPHHPGRAGRRAASGPGRHALHGGRRQDRARARAVRLRRRGRGGRAAPQGTGRAVLHRIGDQRSRRR